MEKTTTALETPLRQQLDRLASYEAGEAPVISLYLNMAPDEHGKAQYDQFLRKAFPERMRTLKGDARKSYERDVERITEHLGNVPSSANGLALFASSGNHDFFEVVQLEVPVEDHAIYVDRVPHLFPLVRLNDQNPRYAALLLDTNSARIFVFGLGTTERRERVENVKTRRTMMGGWSQARYQRHADNFHKQHVREVVDVLERLVRDEKINTIVVACDEVARPLLMEELPKHLAEKIVDTIKLDIRTPEHEVLAQTMDALRVHDAVTDAEHVERMLGAWQKGDLGVVGVEDTLMALEMGQVEELLISATGCDRADELVAKAQQTSAVIRMIEDTSLLEEVGGCGAILRFKI